MQVRHYIGIVTETIQQLSVTSAVRGNEPDSGKIGIFAIFPNNSAIYHSAH